MTRHCSNLLLIGAQPDRYGASRMLFRMAACFVERGIRVTCALPEDGPMVQPLREAGADIRVVSDLAILHRRILRSPLQWVSFLRRTALGTRTLERLCREVRPDVVHTNTSVICPLTTRKVQRTGARRVQHVREFYSDFGVLWPAYRRILLRNADAILCVSESVRRQFDGVEENIEVVYDGFLKDDLCRASVEDTRGFRTRWEIATDALVVGIVGRIKSQRKGQDVFLRAAARLAPRFPSARFVIVGAPFQDNEADAKRLRELSCELGLDARMTWTGELAETKSAYSAMDVVVAAAVTPEPFGSTTIEAMVQARAVVGTATGGTPEQIQDSVSGLLVKPGCPEAMADAVASLLRDPARRGSMGQKGRERVEREFGADRMTNQLMDVYDRLLSRSAAGTT